MATSALRIAEDTRQDTPAPELGLGAADRRSILAGLPAGSVWQADRIAHHAGAVRPTGLAPSTTNCPAVAGRLAH